MLREKAENPLRPALQSAAHYASAAVFNPALID
jgi:hypothetical protein